MSVSVRRFALLAFAPLVLLAGCSDRAEPESPTSTATSAPSASATAERRTPAATPTTADQIPAPVSLAPRPAQAPPRNSQLFIVTGCEACDGPDETLQLHATNAQGVTSATTVMGPGHAALDGMTIGQIAAAADGTVLAVTACRGEYCGGLGNHPVKDWRVLVSLNDGADWTVAFEQTINYVYLAAVTVEGMAVSAVAADGVSLSTTTFTLVNLANQQRKLEPPSAAGRYARPVILPRGDVAWLSTADAPGEPKDKLFRRDGTEIAFLKPATASILDCWTLEDGSLVLQMWANDDRFVALYPSSGGSPRAIVDIDDTSLHGVWPDGSLAVANNFVSGAGPNAVGPVLIDVRALTATPLTTDILKNQAGRNRFIAYDLE